jgi:hypothetical protein
LFLKIAVVVGTHENSPVFRDTLESVLYHLTDKVLVVVDGKGWDQFSQDESIPALKLEGFYHGKSTMPFRNVALGMMKAWEAWGEEVDWYCYLEYDCLVGSSEVLTHLKKATELGYWIVGNDHRVEEKRIPFLEDFMKRRLEIHYLLGCCLFYNSLFMKSLAKDDFFNRFLTFTNFRTETLNLIDSRGKPHLVFTLDEFLYPTLAVDYGGKIGEFACWKGSFWTGNYQHYPMRFRPDLTEEPFPHACVMHPVKEYNNPVREYHRKRRSLH